MKYYVVDVFTERLFGGNPAGVCLLDGGWPPDEIMQKIAAENNLSETAFLSKGDGYYDLRWFTPAMEVDLCGHATMGSAFILFTFAECGADELRFKTLSGTLTVARGEGGALWMDFPSKPGIRSADYVSLTKALGVRAAETYKSADLLVVVHDEKTVGGVTPDFEALKRVKDEAGMPGDNFGVIITARGSDCDYVYRFFAPNAGIDEDPATGRAQCLLVPYWSHRLDKRLLASRQASRRGGYFWCEDAGARVKISGAVKLYLTGELHI